MENPAESAKVVESHGQNILAPDLLMVVLTWVTFFALLFILKKFAWKPILQGLKNREDYIRKSLEDADAAKAQLAQVETTRNQILNEARSQALQIVDDSRKSAAALAHEIEAKAKLNAQDIVNNAKAQIEGERQRLIEALKKQSVGIAISLAGKILKENTDTQKNRDLVNEAVKQL